jgi:hypothetical protein
VTVQAENGTFSNAQCFTSLDGASFALANFKLLTLKNGWTDAPFGTGNAAARLYAGLTQFEGAIATNGTNALAFVLWKALRPATDVYVPVDLCNATNGRLYVQSATGNVFVQAEDNTLSNAQCFTSLDGVSFAENSTGYYPLSLVNGWTNAPFSTSDAAVQNINGIVEFKGAISTTGTNSVPFVLPAQFRPAKDVYAKVDLCNATNGRLHITSKGFVDVEAETFSNAQCFTSLDGASYHL